MLDLLASNTALDRYRPFHVARALTLAELDDHDGAAAAYRRALELPGNDAEDDYLASALAGLTQDS
ncbi:putative RNA polymerase ECF-type sigma factor [Gordonia namibiensis NBRC 108229]|uniref:Putative RNA polymerase ECF-type sigma factor n=1 Tax=Gordonia namibiensis NBRC 108229 TaxID=1208314 RepID=K6VWA2_9ACTN|nr:putative RNA polymerase ECF-type sigma factor [Gordonia namibiensis NBRC 108229]